MSNTLTAKPTFEERTMLAGFFIGAVAYGVHLTLFIWCIHLLINKQKSRLDWFFAVYVSVSFILGNVGNAANIKLGEVLWVDERDFPGGPVAYIADGGGPFYRTCTVTFIVNSWLQDGLMLWRFWMFFARQGRWIVAVLPGLMFASLVGVSLLLIIKLCNPGISLWSAISVNLAIPFWTISIALNIIITACIVGRLLLMRYRVRHLMPGFSGNEYLSITSMLLESAALLTSNGLILLVSYAVNSPIQNLALPALSQTQSIAPLLIILRVLQGHAWSCSTESTLNPDCVSDQRSSNTNVAGQNLTDDEATRLGKSNTESVPAVQQVDKIADMTYLLHTQRLKTKNCYPLDSV